MLLKHKIKIIALLVIVSAVLGVLWDAKQKQRDAEISQADQRADIAETVNDTTARVIESTAVLQQQHRKEDDAARKKHAMGRRDHFDNHW